MAFRVLLAMMAPMSRINRHGSDFNRLVRVRAIARGLHQKGLCRALAQCTSTQKLPGMTIAVRHS